MSYPPRGRKASSNSSSSSSGNSSNASRSKLLSIPRKKEDPVLSSTMKSSVGSDISNVEKPTVRTPRETKSQEKNKNKTVPKTKVLKSEEKAKDVYGSIYQKVYSFNLQKHNTLRIKSETEICFSDLEAEILKSENKLSTGKQLLAELSSLQKCEARIEQLDNMLEGDIYQLQAVLETVNQTMKIANGQVPLTALEVTDSSRDKFLSIIQELSNTRNEIIFIMKRNYANQKSAAQNLEAIASTVLQLRGLIKDFCSTQTSILTRAFKGLALESCLMHKAQDIQLTQIGFKLNFAEPSFGSCL